MRKVRSVENFLLDMGCSAASAQQMAVVAEEVFSNIIRDAWPDGTPGHCTVDVEGVAAADTINVTLRTEDDGVAFDPLAAELPDLDALLEDRPIGGVGILLIKTMTDNQSYQRVAGRNILQVSKKCPRA